MPLLALCLGLQGLAAQSPVSNPTITALRTQADSVQRTVAGEATREQAAVLATAYQRLGDAHQKVRNDSDAVAAYRRAVRYAGLAHDSTTLAGSLSGLGLAHWRVNRYDSALVHLRHARDVREVRGDTAGLGRDYNSIGATNYQLGMYEEALEAFVRAVEIQRARGDSASAARTLTNIGKTYHDWRQYARAHKVLEEAVQTAVRVDSQSIRGYALNSLAMLHIDMGEYAEARGYIAQSIAAYAAVRPPPSPSDSSSAWSLNSAATGYLLIKEGRPAEAIPRLEHLLALGEQRGSLRGQARSLLYLGQAYEATGARARAKAAFERSLALSRRIQQRVLALDALHELASLDEDAGNAGAALRHYRAYQALRDTIFDQAAAQKVAEREAKAETQREQRENERLRADQARQEAVIARQRLTVIFAVVVILGAAALIAILFYFQRKVRARSDALAQANIDLAGANAELRTALSEVRQLKGLIPICASCKKVRDDRGYWEAVETYITSHSTAQFSHSICQDCGPKLYGADWVADEQEPAAR
ncbi:MAG: tetratricopeptide repeat protein [Gemmatimonadota bacterium]|nr:tetratricopeptide repeat protein [Gemmatimonadota bacterium]